MRRMTRRMSHPRSAGPPGSEGRWSLLVHGAVAAPSSTDRRAAMTRQLLERHGVLTREAVRAEGHVGGFSQVYPVLKVMEESGSVRRGYFVAGLGATQFALPGADDRLRQASTDSRTDSDSIEPDDGRVLRLAATDPAHPYGAAVAWPDRPGVRPQRAAGASVVLHDGRLIGWISRDATQVTTFLPTDPRSRESSATALVEALGFPLRQAAQRAVLISAVDGTAPGESCLATALEQGGFTNSPRGWIKRRVRV